MQEKDIHIGDTVQVRQWDDMKDEFGIDKNGNINSALPFAQDAIKLCGKHFTVTEIWRCRPYGLVYYGNIEGDSDASFFLADELEPLADEEWEVANDNDIKSLLT